MQPKTHSRSGERYEPFLTNGPKWTIDPVTIPRKGKEETMIPFNWNDTLQQIFRLSPNCPEQKTDPPSATAEQVYCRNLLDDVERALNELEELEETIIYLEGQEAARNKRRLNYRPWFPISVRNQSTGREKYEPRLDSLRDRLQELKDDLWSRLEEKD